MGFLNWMFGVDLPESQNWRDMGHAQLTEAASAFLTELAQHASLEDAVVVPLEGNSGAELRATLGGYPLRVLVDTFGRMDVELKYERALEFMDLTYDPKLEQAPARPAVEAWNEEKPRHTLVPGIYITGDEELAAFQALAPELQQRILREMYLHRVRLFCSRPDSLEVDFFDSFQKEPSPVEQVAAVLQLGVEVSRKRGAQPPGTTRSRPFDVQRPFQGWDALSEEERWSRAQQFGQALAARLPGARVVERRNDDALDVRWAEGGWPVRLTCDLKWNCLEISARAKGVEAAFDLLHDPDVTIEEDTGASDEWDELEQYLFFARSTFVHGAAVDAGREAAALRALPEALLEELVQALEGRSLPSVSLEDGTLKGALEELARIQDGGDEALRLARLFARIAAALPKGAPPRALEDALQCTYCHGHWFPGPQRQRCTHCGAPLQK